MDKNEHIQTFSLLNEPTLTLQLRSVKNQPLHCKRRQKKAVININDVLALSHCKSV